MHLPLILFEFRIVLDVKMDLQGSIYILLANKETHDN